MNVDLDSHTVFSFSSPSSLTSFLVFSLFIYKTKMRSFSVELCVLTNVCSHATTITTGLWNVSPSDFTLFSLLILVSISSMQTCKGLRKSVRDYHQIAFPNPVSSTSNILSNTAVVSQSLSHIWLFVTPWAATCQPSLFVTVSRSLLKLMSTESVMSSSHVILHYPFLLFPSLFPSIRFFSNESALWINIEPSASVLPMNVQGWFPLGLTSLISFLSNFHQGAL